MIVKAEQPIAIRPVGPGEMEKVRDLFRDYQQLLCIDLCFEGFEQELSTLPGGYAPPLGCLLLAWHHQQPVGCVALRPLGHQPAKAELKRLYVQPDFQGRGIGKRLLREAITMARQAGYSGIWLETLPQMTAARALYLAHGFRPARPHYDNPQPGVAHYHCRLQETPD